MKRNSKESRLEWYAATLLHLESVTSSIYAQAHLLKYLKTGLGDNRFNYQQVSDAYCVIRVVVYSPLWCSDISWMCSY